MLTLAVQNTRTNSRQQQLTLGKLRPSGITADMHGPAMPYVSTTRYPVRPHLVTDLVSSFSIHVRLQDVP